jgi:hypothetical protein
MAENAFALHTAVMEHQEVMTATGPGGGDDHVTMVHVCGRLDLSLVIANRRLPENQTLPIALRSPLAWSQFCGSNLFFVPLLARRLIK